MGRLIADQENTIAVPLDDSDQSVVIDVKTLSLRMGHEVFNLPHIIRDDDIEYLSGDKFREYLEQSPPRKAIHPTNAQIMLIYLSPPFLDIGVIRMHPMPTELL